MKSLEYCAGQAVRTCVGLKPNESAVVIYDNSTEKIADALIDQIRSSDPRTWVSFRMEDYGERPDDGKNPLALPDEIKYALSMADVSFFMAQAKKGEYESFRRPMNEVVDANSKLRHAHMPGITEEVFLKGMSVNYDEVSRFTKVIYDVVKNAKEIRVTTPRGTDFKAEFSPNLKWVISDGIIKPERWGNLPGSEVFTCPINLNGVILVDGVLGDYFDGKYGVLRNNPLTINAKNGRVAEVGCTRNNGLENEFREYIQRDENANRFGELGIGTNFGLERFIGNMLHDEKFPGVHVAVGRPFPEETGADWDSKVHCDMVMKECNIHVDGDQIMLLGKFNERFYRRAFG